MESVENISLQEGSQISPEVSTHLAENVQGFKQCVKEILRLIEQDGNFSEMTAEVYDENKSKLATHVAELSRMHGSLADQHVQLIKKQHLYTTDSSSPQITQMFTTPDQMSNTQKFRTPIGFDVMNSGGTGSFASKIDGSESSFSLSSDSDSESFMSINKLLISPVNDDVLKVKETKGDALLKKIANLEDEVVGLNTKLQTLSDENTKLKNEIHEKESDIQSRNAHLETEKAKVAELELAIADSKLNIETTREELEASRQKVLAAEDEISWLKDELSNKIFEQTHWLQGQLGSTQKEIASLQKQLSSEKDKNAELQEEVSLCVADISVRNDQITELNTMINQSMSEILLLKSTHEAAEDTLKMELREKCQAVDALNKNMDALNLEKDGVKAHLDTLHAEKSHQDYLIRELETRSASLQAELAGIRSSFDDAQKVTDELKLKVVELEREVNLQKEVMSDRAEEKREAIRQLSFSLEHYMSGYKELRQAFVGNKRHAVLTS